MEKSILNELRLLNIAMHRAMHWSMAQACGHGMRKPAVASMVVHFVYSRGGSVMQKEVENEFHLRRSSVSQLLQKLEQDGYIIREAAADGDGRAKRITLSDKGRAEQKEAARQIAAFDEKFETSLSAQEKETFFALAHKIRTNLEKE